jgi:hypothetical protein
MGKKEVKIAAVDFDATIAQYDGWKGKGVFGEPIDGVRNALNMLRMEGWIIAVNTTRSEVDQIKSYLRKYDIHFDYVNSSPRNGEQDLSPSKIAADVYIDDRSLRFMGKWDLEFTRKILDFTPWNR